MAEFQYLDEDMLDLILSKLFDQDRYNFSLVCRSWKAAADNSPLYSIRAPCLIHYNRKKLLWGFFQYNNFFYRKFPDFKNADLLCSKYGWILMCGRGYDGVLSFYNPFNGHTEPLVDLCPRLCTSHSSIHFFHPPTSPDCFIVGIFSSTRDEEMRVDILRYGKCCWNLTAYQREFLFSNAAPVLHRGLLYFVGMRGEVATLDIKRYSSWSIHHKSLEFRKLRGKIRRHFLLKINGDEDDNLYAVFMIHNSERINVFRLLEPEMKWERVKDLGDKMLYLSLASSFGDVAKPKSMANTICLPLFDSDDNLLFYSLKTRKYHSFDGDRSFDNLIGLSRLDYGVTWITPIPTQQLSTDRIWLC